MLSPYRINPNNTNKRTKKNSNTNFHINSHPDSDVKRPHLTSNDFKTNTKSNKKNKHVLKAGFVQENIEINEHYLDKIFDNNNIQTDLAMQIISSDKTVRNDTIEDLKEFNTQSLTTQAKKGEQVLSLMPAIKRAFNLLGDDILELSTENDALKSKIGSYDEKWLEKSKNKMLKQIDVEKRANLIMSRWQNINFLKLVQLSLYKWLIYLIINCGNPNSMASFLKEIIYRIQILII